MIRIIRNLLKQLGFGDVDEGPPRLGSATKMRRAEIRWYFRLEHGTDDGLRTPEEVRSDPALGNTPFIMVTAESKTET